jgi:hypothetical protein
MPLTKLHEKGAQGIFLYVRDPEVDLLSTTLKKLETIEGVSREEFLRRAKNVHEEFAYAPDDDDLKRNKKDTAKMIYSPDRFTMPRMHHIQDLAVLSNPEKLNDYVKRAVAGELPLHFDSATTPKTKYSQKVVGEDLEKRVLDAKHDTLMFIRHPDHSKNRHLDEQFEELARQEIGNHGNLQFARYNGVNESQGYKSPRKLPAIVYFKAHRDVSGEVTGDEKEVLLYEGVNELLLKGVKDH